MDYSKTKLLVISGPNGAGKSTHIQTMLPEVFGEIVSFDRDRIRTEYELALLEQDVSVDMIPKRSTELMESKLVEQMKIAIGSKVHFVLETPLSHADYWKYLDLFENNGYQIQLNYLCLDKVNDCVARVGQRVWEGGHYVAPETIRGVYDKNLEHINQYKTTFQRIELYDGMVVPTLLAILEEDKVTWAQRSVLKKAWVTKGMPVIAQSISDFLKTEAKR